MSWHDASDRGEQTHGCLTSGLNSYKSGRDNLSLSSSSAFRVPSVHQRCIMFDLDGVLVDTRPLVARALGYVATILNVEFPSEKKRLTVAALPPRKAVSVLFPKHPAALSIFQMGINRYVDELTPCSGVEELLDQWRDKRMAVVTSRNQADANFYLSCLGLLHFFQVVITWGQTSRHKPHPDPLLAAARRLGQTTGIYVGDTPDDMIAAKAGSFYPIGALWASQWSRTKLIAAGAAFVAEKPVDLFNHLRDKEA